MARSSGLAAALERVSTALLEAGADTAAVTAVMRRELSKVSPALRPSLVNVFRVLQSQGGAPAKLLIWSDRARDRTIALARERFGEAAEVSVIERPDALLASVSDVTAAVLAIKTGGPWWGRLLARPGLGVIGALPEAAPVSAIEALVIGDTPTEPTGLDVTFWVTDQAGSADDILAGLSQAGFAAELAAEAGGLKLFALAGYVQRDDARLASAPGQMKGVVGSAPMLSDL